MHFLHFLFQKAKSFICFYLICLIVKKKKICIYNHLIKLDWDFLYENSAHACQINNMIINLEFQKEKELLH